MLDLIIKFLEGTSKFLKKHNSTVKEKGAPTKLYSLFVLFLIVLILLSAIFSFFATLIELVDHYSYISYEKGEWKRYFSLFYTVLIIFILIVSFFDIGKSKETITNKFFALAIPSFLCLIENLQLYINFRDQNAILNYSIGLFLIIYPLIHSIQFVFKLNNSLLNKIKRLFFYYNVGFIFFLSFNVLFTTIGIRLGFMGIFSEIIVNIMNGGEYIHGFFEGLFYSLLLSIIVLCPIYILNLYFEVINFSNRKLSIGIFLFILVFSLQYTGGLMNNFYRYQVNKASLVLSTKGENYKAYNDAKGFFLDNSFLNLAKQGQTNNDLFEKLYDSTIEEYFGEKISDYTGNNFSFATNLSKTGEKADVVLSLGEIENKIKTVDNTFTGGKNYYQSGGYVLPYNNSFTGSKHDELKGNFVLPDNTGSTSLVETTYKFHFTNETSQNQEVVMFFETPSQNSVVTGLRLGLDLELIGQIAPRGAARQVYENSLRKNIDPALIEKIGLNTYSIRVFPIPANNDSKSQGKQLVEIKVLSPIEDGLILYSPKFSFANLKTDDDSSFISKVYNNDNLVKEDIIKKDKLDSYLNSNHTIKTSELKINTGDRIINYCLDPNIIRVLNLNGINLEIEKNIKNKTMLFFDNSYSAERNNIYHFYDKISNGFKNYKGKLNDVDLYSYNFDVTKIAEISDIKFWGYTNIDRTIDYIVNNNIENENIVFITDDSNYNKSLDENIGRNLEKLVKNKLSVIKIGKKIKSYKSDFNSILAASKGNIYELNDISELNGIIDSINNKDVLLSNNNCKLLSPNNIDVMKIQAGYVSNLFLSNIKNSSDWYKIAEMQTWIAHDFKIVNQFNSLIAIQTVSQQQELDAYKNQQDKYKADYENHGNSIGEIFGSREVRLKGLESYDSIIPTAVAPASDDFIETTAVAPMPTSVAPFESSMMDYSSSDFSDSTRSSMNFGSSRKVDPGIIGSNSAIEGGMFDNNVDYDYGFSGSTKISLFSLWILIIYIMEFVWIYAFIKKLFKKEETTEIKI